MTRHRGRDKRPRTRTTRSGDGRKAYALEHDTAEELLALLRDEPGDADEDLLGEARDALARACAPSAAKRSQLLIWMSDAERDACVACIDDRPFDTKLVEHVAFHLGKRLAQRIERTAR